MSSSAWIRPLRGSLAIALLGFAIAPGCDDSDKWERLPIDVYALEFADTLQTGSSDSVSVGAVVGYVPCEAEDARIDLRGDSLVFAGKARCRVYRSHNRKPDDRSIATPPATPNWQWIRLSLPRLDPGRYFIVAGTLIDTLEVVPGVTASQRRFAALGDLWQNDPSCPHTPILSVFTYESRWEVLASEVPAPVRVELHGTRAGAASCAPQDLSGALRVRSLVPWSGLLAARRASSP